MVAERVWGWGWGLGLVVGKVVDDWCGVKLVVDVWCGVKLVVALPGVNLAKNPC